MPNPLRLRDRHKDNQRRPSAEVQSGLSADYVKGDRASRSLPHGNERSIGYCSQVLVDLVETRTGQDHFLYRGKESLNRFLADSDKTMLRLV